MAIALLSGCSGAQKHKSHSGASLDGEVLAKAKCSSCHNLDIPPKTSEGEKAPPLYTVTVHLKDWIKADTTAEKRSKFIDFVSTYGLSPSLKTSYCDKKSLKQYGLMPSLKGKATKSEIAAIAAWAFDTYDQMAMLKIMKERNRIAAMPPYKQVLETHDCRLCHILGNGKLAPTFTQIGQKYGPDGIEQIKTGITHGSRGKWPGFHTPMRAYRDLTDKQLSGIATWIANGAKNQ
jgi:cytochrome c